MQLPASVGVMTSHSESSSLSEYVGRNEAINPRYQLVSSTRSTTFTTNNRFPQWTDRVLLFQLLARYC